MKESIIVRDHTRSIAALIALIATAMPAGTSNAQEVPEGPVTIIDELDGVEYRIDIPADWNHGLVMLLHGYEQAGPRKPWPEGYVGGVTSLGYAIAQSRYSAQGWAAKEGIEENEALRRYFVERFGPTYPTIIEGASMGAMMTFVTIERYADVYDGALTICGTSEPPIKFLKEHVFDTVLLFRYFYPGLPGSVVDFPFAERTLPELQERAKALIAANPERLEVFNRMTRMNPGSAAYLVACWSELLWDLMERTGGNAFDNSNTIYVGSDDDRELNREIARYRSDPEAVKFLTDWPLVTGEISDPVIVLYTLNDDFIPPESTAYYEQLIARAGASDLFVRLYVDRIGHCEFEGPELIEALDRLTKWIVEGKKPKAGEITKGAVD